jgi:hypothetical protein
VSLFRRRPKVDADPDRALYVHLALDGGIFVVRGETGEQFWTDRDGLHRQLKETVRQGGVLLYSREAGEDEPPEHIEETFRQIIQHGLPIKLLEEPHPEATVPPERRRDILR